MIFNKERETMSEVEREALQLHLLKNTLERVYENNVYYKNAMDNVGVKPEDVT